MTATLTVTHRWVRPWIMGAALAIASLQPQRASADDLPPEGPSANRPDRRYRFVHAQAAIGAMFIEDPAFDPYSQKDAIAQLAVGGGATVLSRGMWSFAPGLLWTFGSATESARSAQATLTAHRFTIPLEARAHTMPGLFAFVRLAPGVVYQTSTLRDQGSPRDTAVPESLQAESLTFAADASVGFSFLIDGRGYVAKPTPRFWVTPEFGYAFATRGGGRHQPSNLPADDPRRFEPTELAGAALRGLFFRVGLTLSI